MQCACDRDAHGQQTLPHCCAPTTTLPPVPLAAPSRGQLQLGYQEGARRLVSCSNQGYIQALELHFGMNPYDYKEPFLTGMKIRCSTYGRPPPARRDAPPPCAAHSRRRSVAHAAGGGKAAAEGGDTSAADAWTSPAPKQCTSVSPPPLASP